MRKRLVIVLVLLNALLAGAFLAREADTQILPRGLFSCCESEGGDLAYCCRGCCWFRSNCEDDSDCGKTVKVKKLP